MSQSTTMQPARDRALASMLLGAALIGTNALMVRWAGMPPTASAFWRMAFSGVFLLALVLARGQWRPMPWRAWAWSLLPALAFATDLWSWHRSILLVGPGLATLLGNAQVFFMALAGALLFGERLGPRFVAGLALAFLGLWLLLGQEWGAHGSGYRLGVWLGLVTGVCYALYNISLRAAQRHALASGDGAGIVQVLGIAALGTALLLGLAGGIEGVSFAIPTPRAWTALLVLALVGHCLSWILISKAMRTLPVALVGLLLLLQPVVAFLLDVGLLGRQTSGREWTGVAVSLAGIFVAGLRGRQRLPEQPA